MMRRWGWALSLLASVVVGVGPSWGAEDRPGLIAHFEAGSAAVDRVDDSLSFDWRTDRADERLPVGPFRARWHGTLFVPEAGPHRLAVDLIGKVRLRLDGVERLRVDPASDGIFASEPIDLTFGEHVMEVEYERVEGAGRLHLLWSSDRFETEPIPAFRLTHRATESEGSDPVDLVSAARCAACHEGLGEPWPSPRLSLGPGRVLDGWLVDYLTGKRGGTLHQPHLNLSAEQARQVAGYLSSSSPTPNRLPDPASGQEARGEELFESLGCLACHQVDGIGSAQGPGGNLTEIASKRSAGYLAAWLKNPASLEPEHQMPRFDLSPKEVNDLVSYLTTLGTPPPSAKPDAVDSLTEEDRAAGRGLIEQHRCASCHAVEGISSPARRPVTLAGAGCVGEPSPSGAHPGYRFAPADQQRLLDYVRACRTHVGPVSIDRRGEAILDRHHCLGCHARGNERGWRDLLVELGKTDLREQAVRSAPTLQTVGEKLHEDWLARAVRGEAPRQRPWLAPRMPHFRLQEDEGRDLVNYFISHDRWRGEPPSRPSHSEAEQRVAAQRLVGPAGFGCVSCHAVGKHVPIGGEVSARGPDLAQLGERIRVEWYRRWTRNPARIAGGVEMPAIQLASPGLLDNHLDAQLMALWVGLNSADFQVPVQQAVRSLSALGGERAVVLRDLVEHSPKETTSRPFVIGLTNGHSLMIDLDRMAIRHWSMGDLAHEQTRGKSWYWTLAGTSILDQRRLPTLFQRWREGRLEPVGSVADPSFRLAEWRHHKGGVGLAVDFLKDQQPAGRIHLLFEPIDGGFRSTFETSMPDWGIVLPVGESFSTEVGPAQLTVTGGDPIDGGQSLARRLSGPVVVDWRLVPRVEPVPALSTIPVPDPPRRKTLRPLPGYQVERLSLSEGPMPTALAVRPDGSLLVASLKGGVYSLRDTDGDGDPDTYRPFADELSAPFGLLVEPAGTLVIHKHELLRLHDDDGDDFAERSVVVASGWGVTPDYHDWMVGPVPDGQGQYFLAASCQQDKRPTFATRGRGKLLRTTPTGGFEIVADGLRFPMGLAAGPHGDLFATDNQGVTNPFNEINHLRPGKHFGFWNAQEKKDPARAIEPAAIEIPHPWTGSVNGLALIPTGGKFGPFDGQWIGAEYTTRRLVRMSLQPIGETFQGCVYPFGEVDQQTMQQDETFLGPISLAFTRDGTLYVGSMIDSGWGGGNNRGAVERVRRTGPIPFGIREVRAWAEGFDIDWTSRANPADAGNPNHYQISSYTRRPQGGYATPDSDRQSLKVLQAVPAPGGLSVRLWVEPLREGFVHEIGVNGVRAEQGTEPLYPGVAYFTLRQVPLP